MNDAVRVLVFIAAWVGFGVVSGVLAAVAPNRWFDHDSALTRIRSFEAGGRLYQRRLRVLRWKDRLPEAGGLFRSDGSKAHLGKLEPTSLQRLVRETRRAEWVHWSNAVFGWTFFAWNEAVVGWLMVAFGAVVHLPFVVVQRYNRARSLALLDQMSARAVR